MLLQGPLTCDSPTNIFTHSHLCTHTYACADRFGKDRGLFAVELGNLSPVSGVYFFGTEEMDDIFHVMDRFARLYDEPIAV